MSLTPGSSVGRYQVRELLGSGGMGEVYKAHDPTLGRPVALKVLRAALSADQDRVTRFLQEARAASALNHPNILTIHEVGDLDAARFIVLEFVEGETLRRRMQRGPLTLREILDIGIQTASALAAAHAAGIVHRDIKPENLMLRPDGYVKVLDFGVAKLIQQPDGPAGDVGLTVASDTGLGLVVGTIAYMAPEQARGLAVDGRADAFSLGVVLYELVTGRAPFAGDTPSDVLVALLDREPAPIQLRARGVPLQLEWIVAKALEKDPALRYQTIADLRVDLLRLKAAVESGRVADAAAAAVPVGDVDQPLEISLADDSPQVRAVSGVSRRSAVLAAAAAAALVAAVVLYGRARPGADLPVELPRGAVATKARDAAERLGYPAWGPRHAIDFDGTLDVANVTALAGLPAAREAIRAGAVGQWEVGASQTRDPRIVQDNLDPRPDEYSIQLDPTGDLVGFAAGVAPQDVAALDRDRATALGQETIRRVFGVDASTWALEFIQRAFPAGTVEMTWRSPERRFGHIEQIRLHLHGERIVRLARSFERPPGFTEPERSVAARVFRVTGPVLVGVAIAAAWVFGLYTLVRARNWDALKHRVPIALTAVTVAAMGLSTLEGSSGWQGLLGAAVLALILPAMMLPAFSGIVVWVQRQNAGRLWAVDCLLRGRLAAPGVAASLVDGVAAGAALAAVLVAADGVGLLVDGFVPSIERELDAMDHPLLAGVANALMGAAFITPGLALGVEVLERLRLRPAAQAAVIAGIAALTPGGRHLSALALAPPAVSHILVGLLVVTLYRRRGFLAAFVAMAVSSLLLDAMALRSLDDPDLVWRSNVLLAVAAAPLAAGIWVLLSARLRPKGAAPAGAAP